MSVAAGLVCAAGFFFLLRFNQQGQIILGSSPFRTTRLWILRGVEGRGLGVSTTRPLGQTSAEPVCAQTTVRFYFLDGPRPEAEASYCECFSRTESGWAAAGTCPE